MEIKEEIKETITDNPMMWGTRLDYIKGVPTEYAGRSFFQIDHNELEEFFKLSNLEKFEMAYWIERDWGKRSSRTGLVSGIIIGIVIGFIFSRFFLF